VTATGTRGSALRPGGAMRQGGQGGKVRDLWGAGLRRDRTEEHRRELGLRREEHWHLEDNLLLASDSRLPPSSCMRLIL
jgi:hypothetical protein